LVSIQIIFKYKGVKWNGGCDFVKLSVFKEGILVESNEYYSVFVKDLVIKSGIEDVKIYGNNIKAIIGGFKFLNEPVEFDIKGGVGNICTTESKYVFDQIKPNVTVGNVLTITGGIDYLEVIERNIFVFRLFNRPF